MTDKQPINYTLINPLSLTIILAILKVSGYLPISWWWITCPLWITPATLLILAAIVCILTGITMIGICLLELIKWLVNKYIKKD